MENIYSNVGIAWTESEDNRLIEYYVNNEMSIIDIALNHKRLPGGIIARLKYKGIIQDTRDARGFDEYAKLKKSGFYDQYKKKQTQDHTNLAEQVSQLQNEVKQLKCILKDVVFELFKLKHKVDSV
jgi:hypothetical protein